MHIRCVVLLVLISIVAGCGGGDGSSSSTPSPAAEQPTQEAEATPQGATGPLKFKVVGECYSEPGGGTLIAESSGFTPNSTYSRRAWYPLKPGVKKRSEYRFLKSQSTTDSRGRASFEWDCNFTNTGQADPPGKYKLEVIDDETGRNLTVYFRIRPASG